MLFDAEEQHLMSVAVAPDGTVYAGASDKAKLYKITGPGRATVLYDFARTEVRSIAIGPKGDIYAIANELKGVQVPSRQPRGSDTSPAGPVSSPGKNKGKGTLYRFTPDGKPDRLLDNDEEHFTSLTLGDDGQPYVGTGVEGRVYTVNAEHHSALVADVDERQIGALVLKGAQKYVIGSDPIVIHAVRGVGRPRRRLDQQGLRRGPARSLRAHRLGIDRGHRGLDPHRQHQGARRDLEPLEPRPRRSGNVDSPAARFIRDPRPLRRGQERGAQRAQRLVLDRQSARDDRSDRGQGSLDQQ